MIQIRGNARKKWNDFAENACCNLLTIVYNTKKGCEKTLNKKLHYKEDVLCYVSCGTLCGRISTGTYWHVS